MAKKEVPPLITDPTAFIRGANDTPEPVVIGAQSARIDAPEPEVAPEPPKKSPRRPRPKPASKHEAAPAMPWEDGNPRVKNYVQLRMPEPLNMKLKWIKENSLGVPSVHDLILKTLEDQAEKRIKEIQERAGR